MNVNTNNQRYNLIPNWEYTKLPEIFCGEAFTAKVKTVGELKQASAQVELESKKYLYIIEIIPEDPMDTPQYLAKSRTILQSQNQNK